MCIQRTEDWHLWEKLLVLRRQALRHTVASIPRRNRFASIVVMLLIATWLLGASAFGQSDECPVEHLTRVGQWYECEMGINRRPGGWPKANRLPGEQRVIDRCCKCYGICESGMSCPDYHLPTRDGDCVEVVCAEGYNPTPEGTCTESEDHKKKRLCEECRAQFVECEKEVEPEISRCQYKSHRFAKNICGNRFRHCDGGRIRGGSGVCPGELTVYAPPGVWSSSVPLCDGTPVSYFTDCLEEYNPEGTFDFPRCVGMFVDDCINKCMETDAGGVTLAATFYGVSVAYTIPSNIGYITGCINQGKGFHAVCDEKEKECEQKHGCPPDFIDLGR